MRSHEPAQKQSVGPGIRADLFADHALQQLQGPSSVLVRNARLKQVGVDVHIQAKAVLARNLFADVEGLLQTHATASQLRQHRQSVVCWRHASLLHLTQQPDTTLVKALSSAAVEEGVVGVLIRSQLGVTFHILQKLERLVHAALLAVALDDCAVGDDVWRDALEAHLLQDRLDSTHLVAPSAGIHQSVACHNGELDLLLQHLLVHSPDLLKLLLLREALED
mmetsp:Transcript_36452/g.79760  ORF Transcript_36452/g.79760 Transcript_36452/m.79760 type:complete len:222 (+) Transcript_36452:353-1018(+)